MFETKDIIEQKWATREILENLTPYFLCHNFLMQGGIYLFLRTGSGTHSSYAMLCTHASYNPGYYLYPFYCMCEMTQFTSGIFSPIQQGHGSGE